MPNVPSPEQILGRLAASWEFEKRPDGYDVVTPYALGGADLITLSLVSQGSDVIVTDLGCAVQFLDVQGVDLSKPAVMRSVAHIRDSVDMMATLRPDWEMSVQVPWADVATGIELVVETVMRAGALTVLSGERRPTSFAEVATQEIASRFAIEPKPKLPLRYGAGRTVSCKILDGLDVYVQVASGRDRATRSAAYDHTRSLFLDTTVDPKHRAIVCQGDSADWDDWQVAGFRDSGTIVGWEDDLNRFLEEVSAGRISL